MGCCGGGTGSFTNGAGAHRRGGAVLVACEAVRSSGRGVSTLCVGVRSGGHGAEALGQRLGDVQRSRYFTTRTNLADRSYVDVGADAQHYARTVHSRHPGSSAFHRQDTRGQERRSEVGQERNQIARFNLFVAVGVRVVREARLRLCRGLTDKTKDQEGQSGQGPHAVLPNHVPQVRTKTKKEGRPEGRPSNFYAQAQWEGYSMTSNFFVVTKSFELTRIWYRPDSKLFTSSSKVVGHPS